MVRRHGWELPAHSFQVVAITVFSLLAVAFYVFLAPFLWIRALEIAAFAVYSPVACTVFLLYIRSSAIDPADRGVFCQQPGRKHSVKASLLGRSSGMIHGESIPALSPELSTLSRSSSIMLAGIPQSQVGWQKSKGFGSFPDICGLLCGWFVKDDTCGDDFKVEQPVPEEDILFCTLCKAEVRKFSKHCRSCDKCVDGFDHHCRWLNNCVGRKNYNTFVVLMAASLSLLVLEWAIGMAVFVRCFVDKDAVQRQIVDKLGNRFTLAPFATVVALCTFVSFLASIPLGELFFFHLILIKKGITTYEYVVAMRAQNEPHVLSAEGDVHSIPASPSSSSATGLSGSSSRGVQYAHGAWCTPPRVFIEHQPDEVMSHLGPSQLPSTVDPDVGFPGTQRENTRRKDTVRISAWKLSKLNVNEVARAAAHARENSSVLRHLGPADPDLGERAYSSSSNVSVQSSLSTDYLSSKRRLRDTSVMVEIPSICPVTGDSDIQEEHVRAQPRSTSSCSSPRHNPIGSTVLSPLPAELAHGFSVPMSRLSVSNRGLRTGFRPAMMGASYGASDMSAHNVTIPSHSSGDFSRGWTGPPGSSDGYEASSGGESADDDGYPWMHPFPSRGTVLPDHRILSSREAKRAPVFWERTSARYGPVPTDRGEGGEGISSTGNYTLGSDFGTSDLLDSPGAVVDDQASEYPSEMLFHPQGTAATRDPGPRISSSSLNASNLIYSGTSIFYGGPIAEPPLATKADTELALPRNSTPNANSVMNRTSREGKPHTQSGGRSKSPVFAPRGMPAPGGHGPPS